MSESELKHQYYNVSQAAKILGIARNTLYKFVIQGKIKTVQVHRRFLITKEEIINYLNKKEKKNSEHIQ